MESQNLFCWISVSNCAGLSLGCKDSQSGTRKYFRFKKFICFFVQKLVSKLHNKHDFTFDPSKWISYLSTKMFKKMVKSLSCAMLLYWKSFPNILRNFSRFFVWCHNVEESDKRGPSPRLRTHATEVQWQTLDRAHNLLQRLVSFFFQAEKISVVSF